MRTYTRSHVRSIWLLMACMVAVLLTAGSASATSYCIEKELDLYGYLNQNSVLPWGGVACAPTAAVNSLVYLQNKYPNIYDTLLVPDVDGDGFDNDDMIAVVQTLGGQGYMNTIINNGTFADDFMYGKYRYIEGLGPGEEGVAPGRTRYEAMSIWDWTHPLARAPAVPNPEKPSWVTTGVYPTWQFLYEELVACEDVEIALAHDTGGHCLTLTSFCWNDVDDDMIMDFAEEAFIDYIDPWTGLHVPQTHIWQSSMGGAIETAYWDGTDSLIAWAVSESPIIPEPISLIFFGTGLVGVFGFVSRKRMRRNA